MGAIQYASIIFFDMFSDKQIIYQTFENFILFKNQLPEDDYCLFRFWKHPA